MSNLDLSRDRLEHRGTRGEDERRELRLCASAADPGVGPKYYLLMISPYRGLVPTTLRHVGTPLFSHDARNTPTASRLRRCREEQI
jgi:hypothetical protein